MRKTLAWLTLLLGICVTSILSYACAIVAIFSSLRLDYSHLNTGEPPKGETFQKVAQVTSIPLLLILFVGGLFLSYKAFRVILAGGQEMKLPKRDFDQLEF